MAEEKVDTSKFGYRKKLRKKAAAKAMNGGKDMPSKEKKPKKSAAEYLDSPSKKSKK